MTDERYEKLSQELGPALSAMYLAKATMERIEAENARLREALLEISESDCPDYCASCELMCNACIAKEALVVKE